MADPVVENVGANVRWRMPRKGMVKINVHGCFYDASLPNGNVSGIGAVIRNSRGKILRMLSGSLGIQHRRINEYHAMLEGCKRAFIEDWEHFNLESDHLDSFWEWRNSTLEGVHPDHTYIVQQLNQRGADRNFQMEPTLCDPNTNELATYFAHHGAHNYKVMVIIAQPFGRIFEIWSSDMGLGPADQRYMAIHEADLVPEVVDGEAKQVLVVEDDQAEAYAAGLMNAG